MTTEITEMANALEKDLQDLFEIHKEMGAETKDGILKITDENMDEILQESFRRLEAKKLQNQTNEDEETILDVEAINNMLNEAAEEYETEIFKALVRINGIVSTALQLENVDAFFKCSEQVKKSIVDYCIDNLLTLAEVDESGGHLIAYTLKMIEVNEFPKQFPNGKIDFKESVLDMIYFLENENILLFAETRSAGARLVWRHAKNMAITWNAIIDFYDEIYDVHFDEIWN